MNIFASLNNKQPMKYLLAYLCFFILNYGVCLAPIGVSYYFTTPHTFLISSLFCYCFTLVAVTVYSFIFFPKENLGGTIVANLAIIIAITFMIGYIAAFILYNLVQGFADPVNKHILPAFLLTFTPVFILTIVLSIPVIKSQVEADKGWQMFSKIKKEENTGEAVIDELNRKGIS